MKNENELRLKSIIDSDIEKAVLDSNSFPDVCRKLGFDPNIGHIKSNIRRKIKRIGLSTDHFDSVIKYSESKTRYKKEKLIELVEKFTTLNDILLELDLLPVSTNYKKLRKVFKEFEIDDSKFRKVKNRIFLEKEKLQEIVLSSFTYKECLEKLGIRAAGGNYKFLQKYIKIYNINIDHFLSEEIRRDKFKNFISKSKRPIDDILKENVEYSRTSLKRRLYSENILKPICSLCGQDENWNGMKISLILDHINGIYNDNRLENLRIVCPNCNAGLDTFAGKNIKKQANENITVMSAN